MPPDMHPHAALAAEASMAAQEQGKFWEYHDKLFANQHALDRASLSQYAADVGLDVEQFTAALDSSKFKSAVEAQVAEARSFDIRATPTFLVNGRIVKGNDLEKVRSLIDEELRDAETNAAPNA